jgi:phenylpyruvate tautomerase PptA (4-oxalocrotonate tautomerase family)
VPLVRIEVLGERTAAERVELFDAVHEAIVSAFRVPEDDRTQRLVEHAPGTFEIPPGQSERYTLIEITAFPGRSVDAKRSLYRAIVRNLAEIGIPEGDISIVLTEPPLEDWGIRGGHSADEVDLGYRLDV